MDEKEYHRKYVNLRILKSIQDYLKDGDSGAFALHPMRIPEELLYQVVKLRGPDEADELIHQIFRTGLTIWSERLYTDEFGSERRLQEFIDLVRKRNKA